MSKPKSFRRTKVGARTLHPTTQMMSYGYDPAMSEGAVKPPVFLTSTFAFQSAEEGADFFDVAAGRKPTPQDGGAGGLVYSRFNHPNTEIVEDRLVLLDGAESALLTASGMAAIGATFLTLTPPGDAIVHYTPLYGGTETLLTKRHGCLGGEIRFVHRWIVASGPHQGARKGSVPGSGQDALPGNPGEPDQCRH